MIFTWLKSAVFFLLRLVIPPPLAPEIPKLDVDAPCPSCGHRSGSLTAVQQSDGKLQVRHDCRICKAKWFEDPVLKAPDKIQAGPAAKE